MTTIKIDVSKEMRQAMLLSRATGQIDGLGLKLRRVRAARKQLIKAFDSNDEKAISKRYSNLMDRLGDLGDLAANARYSLQEAR